MKKRILMVVTSAALVSILLLGLGSCKAKEAAPTGSSTVQDQGQRSKGSLPLADGNVTFSMFVGGSVGDVVSSLSYADNTFTKKVVDQTGIKLDIIWANSADRAERMNLMLSTGNYPDIVVNDAINLNDLNYYAGQGIFVPLDAYDPLSYPNIKAAFDEYPAIKEKITGSDGKMYALPALNDCLHCVYSMGRVWYYMPWVRDTGRKVPETTDEFLDYLRWVRDSDPNGNGRKDEIGIAFNGASIDGNTKNFISYFAKPFLPFVWTGLYFGLAMDGKTIVEQYRDPRFREALNYMSTMWKEGLIAPDSFTMTRDQVMSLTGAEPPVLAVQAVNWMNDFNVQPSIRWIETFNLPALKGPNGQRNAGNQDPWSIITSQYFITDKCKDPDLAVALYNYFIEFENMMDGYIGPKGIGWSEPDPGETSLSATTPLYKLLVTYGSQPHNSQWDQANPMLRSSAFRLGEQATGAPEARRWLESGDPSLRDQLLLNNSYAEEMWYFTSLKNSEYAMPQAQFIPPLALSEDDNSRYSDIYAVLNPFLDRACVEFITGVRNINSDADWNNYLSELDRMNSKERVSILQKYIK
jgi:putative aldouronate transport system substrate-binding protein